MSRELRVFTGSAHPALGESIARFLGVPCGRAHLARFSDGEIWFQIQDNVRGADVFVVQPTSPPVNENLMELLVMLDAFKRSSASRITDVIRRHLGPVSVEIELVGEIPREPSGKRRRVHRACALE